MMLSAEQILRQCDCGDSYAVSVHPILASTNTTVRQLAAEGAVAGTVVFAEQQTGGRGRLGRSFFSPPGSGIYMTLLLRPVNAFAHATTVTTFAAVAVLRAIERVTALKPAIKWVNDIWIGRKKVCGILAEGAIAPDGSGFSYIALGIGINVQKTAFPEELSQIATSLETECGHEIDRNQLAASLLSELHPLLSGNLPSDTMDVYRWRNLVPGKQVTVLIGDRSYSAIADTIEEDGSLTVILENGTSIKRAIHIPLTQPAILMRASPPKVVTAFWVWPLGKEYPVAAPLEPPTGEKSGSRTQGRSIRQVIFKN